MIFTQATSVGTKETEATNFLEKKFKNNPQYSFDDVVQIAISALQVNADACTMACSDRQIWAPNVHGYVNAPQMHLCKR